MFLEFSGESVNFLTVANFKRAKNDTSQQPWGIAVNSAMGQYTEFYGTEAERESRIIAIQNALGSAGLYKAI